MMKSTRNSMRAVGTTAGTVVLTALLLAPVAAAPVSTTEATLPRHDGKIVFASDRTSGAGVNNPEGDFEIFTMSRDGSGLRQLTDNAALDFNPEWSPNGKQIAFQSDRELTSGIFVMDADGARQTRITKGQAFDRNPSFSSDGRRIAFDSNLAEGEGVDNPEGDFEIFSVGVDGKGLTQLTRNQEADFQPDHASVGRKLAFVSRRRSGPGIYTMNVDGTGQRRISRGPAQVFQAPSWSPDGGRLAFVSDQDGLLNIYTMRADGRGQVRLTDSSALTVGAPVFSPNGRTIAFHTNRDGNFEIYTMRADGSRPANLTNDPAGDFTPDWRPANRRR